MLYNILGEISLRREQVVSTITDNGSNFVKVFKGFGCDFRVENDSDYYGKYEILNVS